MKREDVTVVVQPREQLAAFVAEALGDPEMDFGNYSAVGFMDSRGLKAALVYNNFHYPNICMHIAARPGSLWCRRDILYHIFNYPFGQLECSRVTAPVNSRNRRAVRVVEALGYKLEGTLRRAGRMGGDVLIYGMLREECKWVTS